MKQAHLTMVFLTILILSACSSASQPEPISTSQAPALPTSSAAPTVKLDSVTFQPGSSEGISLMYHSGIIYQKNTAENDRDVAVSNGIDNVVDRTTIPLIFDIDDDFKVQEGEKITLTIDYFDNGYGPVILQYDSYAEELPGPGNPKWALPAYRAVVLAYRDDSRTWKTLSVVLNDAKFTNGQEIGSDFSLFTQWEPLKVSNIEITKGGVLTSAPTPYPTASTPADYPQPLGERAVLTYYFFWYDTFTGDHMTSMSHLTPDYPWISMRDPEYHKMQFREMVYAGIDAFLPIYWYDPTNLYWSMSGTQAIAQALKEMRDEGTTPPAVGMFLDTTSSEGLDLRLEQHQSDLYEHIHYFYSTIPSEYWARTQEGRPVIWAWISYGIYAYDQSVIDYIYKNFEKDFGVRPYLVFDASWDYPGQMIDGQPIRDYGKPPLKYDAAYRWVGTSRHTSTADVTSIIPGFDDRMGPEQTQNYVDRMNGDTYKNGYSVALKCNAPWLVLETWNEYHEGTEISESVEHGREYIELTRELVPYFKGGQFLAGTMLQTKYSVATSVKARPDDSHTDVGLFTSPSWGDGQYSTVEIAGRTAFQTIPMSPDATGSYLYFGVDEGFYFSDPKPIMITFSYFDEGYEAIALQYDTTACGAPFNETKAYKWVPVVRRKNTQTWQTASVVINDATFVGSQNYGADFRLTTDQTPLTIEWVEISKAP